jgi:hypothetical protein
MLSFTRSLEVVDRVVPCPAGIGRLRGSNPIRAARIYADIQQSFGARDRATLTMRVVRLSCCFVWFDLARCQMVFPEQRGVMHTRRGPALSARPLACLYITYLFSHLCAFGWKPNVQSQSQDQILERSILHLRSDML